MPWLLRMLVNVSVLTLLGYLLVGWQVNQALAQLTSLPEPRRQQVILLAVILLNLYPAFTLITYFIGSDTWALALGGGSRLLDISLAYPFWVGVLVVAQLAPLLLLIELGRFGVAWWGKDPTSWPVWSAKVTLLLTGVVCVYTMARVYSDTQLIRIRERVIHSTKLTPTTPELRIVHITDVQVDPRTGPSLVRAFVRRVNELNPDVVLFSGDLVTSGTDYIDQAAALLGQIRARRGVFACLGDHDYWADPQWIARSLRQHGIEVIEDESRRISLGSGQMEVTGVTNVYSRRPTWSRLDQIASDHDPRSISVFLTHQPSGHLIELAAKHGYDLFLAGHTHGGQIVLNYFGFRLTPVMTETQFISGFYDVGRMLVSISNGLGLTFAPVRFQAPAEITLLRLKPVETSSPAAE